MGTYIDDSTVEKVSLFFSCPPLPRTSGRPTPRLKDLNAWGR